MADAEAMECEAYAAFEAALAEFLPRLIALFQATRLEIPDDHETAVAQFWDCLQRPATHGAPRCAPIPLRELAREFSCEAISEE